MSLEEQWKQEIEKRLVQLETYHAVDAERYRQMIKRLDAIDGHLSWIFKILIGGILGALVTFIIKGGLTL